MKRLGILLLCVLCTSCSTLGTLVDQNGTSADTAKALCNDAKLGMLVWSAMQDDSTDPVAVEYWAKYKKGVDLVITTYCLEK